MLTWYDWQCTKYGRGGVECLRGGWWYNDAALKIRTWTWHRRVLTSRTEGGNGGGGDLIQCQPNTTLQFSVFWFLHQLARNGPKIWLICEARQDTKWLATPFSNKNWIIVHIQYFFHLVNMKWLSPSVAQAGASRQAGCRSSSIFSPCSFNFNSSNCCSTSLFSSTCFTCFSSNLLTSNSHDKVPLQAPDNLRLFPLAFILFPERNTKLFPVHFEVHLSSLDCLLIRVFYCQLWKFACSLFLLVLRQNAREQLIDDFRIFWVFSIC